MGLTVIVCLINKGILCQLSVHISVHTWVWTQSAGGCSLCLTARSMDLFSLSSLWLEHMVNPPTVGTPGIKKSTLMERKKSFISGKNISQLSVLADFPDCPWTAKIGFSWNGKLWMQINLLHLNISMQVLHTYLYTFPLIHIQGEFVLQSTASSVCDLVVWFRGDIVGGK